MTNKLTQQEYLNYNEIELRIHLQRSIEILDEFARLDHSFKNKPLNQMLKALYPALDKQTKKYNEIFQATETGTSVFYDIVQNNIAITMSATLPGKNTFNQFIMAYEADQKSVDGIITKVLRNLKHKTMT